MYSGFQYRDLTPSDLRNPCACNLKHLGHDLPVPPSVEIQGRSSSAADESLLLVLGKGY